MIEGRRVPPPMPLPDQIVITVKMGKAVRVLEVPGKHRDRAVTTLCSCLTNLSVGDLHGWTVKLRERES